MLTIRGWFKEGFEPKSLTESGAYKFVPGYGAGRERRSEEHLLFSVQTRLDGKSGRWYFDFSDLDSGVKDHLQKVVEFWSLEDHYLNPALGEDPILYAAGEGKTATARFEPSPNTSTRQGTLSTLRISNASSLEELRDFYRRIRKGEATIVEIWNGKGRNNVTELQEQVTKFREELTGAYDNLRVKTQELGKLDKRVGDLVGERDNALAQLGKLVTESSSEIADLNAKIALKDRYVGELEARIAELNGQTADKNKEISELAAELAAKLTELSGSKTRITTLEKELGEEKDNVAQLDGEKHSLETDLRLLREGVVNLVTGIWRDLQSFPWWGSRRRMRRMVENDIHAAPALTNLLPFKLQAEMASARESVRRSVRPAPKMNLNVSKK